MAIDLPRETALKILYEINEKKAYSNISIDKHLEKAELKNIDRAFITELVYGVVKWKLTIDWVIEQYSSVKMNKISPWILNVLRLGVYQLLYTQKIPESAACNESVNLAKKYGHSASSRFVNGVLRNIARNKNTLTYPDENKNLTVFLSVKYSHPEWMVKEWTERFGREFTESLLKSNNEIPEFTVRTNTLKTTREQLADSFNKAGMETSKGRYVENALIIKSPGAFSSLEIFKAGHFQVQDESSMLVGKILDPRPGELVMDVCSAPGGKAAHIAELMGNRGAVIARDVHEHKIKLIKEAAGRLGIDIIKTEIYDASKTDEKYRGKADRVLIDAPCTGLGIIRKKPDIKWARNAADKKEITQFQRKILNASSQYVKPGGILVYSTCTIEKEENQDMVKEFIDSNDDFELEDITPYLPEALKESSFETGVIQLFPNVNNIDGFFIARMRRRG
jgi:16S rRNA (cytosine967-C5)-methyltransferase